jgi:signal transduction histidine kinase
MTLSTSQIEVGPFQFFYYQAPVFLLLRFVSARLIAVLALIILSLMYLINGGLPYGVFIEVGSFILLITVMGLFATTGKPEQRILVGLFTLLLVCFPLYAVSLSYFRSEGLLYCAANAAIFVIPTALSLVLIEGLWSVCHLTMGEKLQRLSRHEEFERPSLVSIATVAIVCLVASIFAVFLLIWGNRWSEILTENTQIRADQFANSQLMANRNDVNNAAGLFLRNPREAEEISVNANQRFIALQIPVEAMDDSRGLVIENTVPGSAWHEQAFRSLEEQLPRFIYRAQMAEEATDQITPFYLVVNEINYPVYSFNSDDDRMLFLIDSGVKRISNEMGTASTMKTNLVTTADYPFSVTNDEGDFKNIIRYDWLGGILLGESSDQPPALSVFASLTRNTRIAVLISDELKRQFPLELPYDATFIVQSEIWPRLEVMFRAAVVMTVFLVSALIISAGFALGLTSGFVRPLKQLLDGFRSAEETGQPADSFLAALAYLSIEISPAATEELHTLQQKLRSYAEESDRSNERLKTSAAGYESLLGAMPIGVMEIDDNYQLCFRNEAMAEITGDSAEAAYRLRIKAEQLFEASQWDAEYSLPLLNESPRQLSLLLLPRLDDAGSAAGFWMLVTDLTKQKAMDAQLLQSSKLATLGEMSTGMAHELNQPLNIIKLAVSNVKNSINKGRLTEESMISRLERIDSAVGRAATIIDHMRAFGRVAGEGVAPFTIVSAVNAAADLVREPMAAKGVDLINQIQEPVWVQGNTIQFEQVLINMVNNARDAILDASASGAVTLRQTLEDGFVTVMIEDTGGGIPPEVVPHVFEPFYTTKPVGKGTGLGGSISYGIVQDMQGTIWAENVGEGARISIRLPIYSKEKETVAEMGQ